jgi:hypothetical protein
VRTGRQITLTDFQRFSSNVAQLGRSSGSPTAESTI